MDGLGADDAKEVCSKEGKEEVVCGSTSCGHPLASLHRHKHLGLEDVGNGDGGVGEDDGQTRPEEPVHEDGVEGGEGDERRHHRRDASEGEVGSPPYHPARAWKMSFHFGFLWIFVKTFVVVVVVSIVSQLVRLLIGFCSEEVGEQVGPEGVSEEGKGRDVGSEQSEMQTSPQKELSGEESKVDGVAMQERAGDVEGGGQVGDRVGC